MRWTAGLLSLCLLASAALLVTAAPAAAAPKAITGKLSKPGYTVSALAMDGTARSVRAKQGKFKLRPTAKRVTLQLRALDGNYAGPIVVSKRKKGKRAILGVRAGAKLGKVKVKPRKGYAKVMRTLPQEFIDAGREARAKKGVPIGAGNFGRVRSKNARGGAPGDLDLDGIPDPLDIDDNGNLVLDGLDQSSAARSAQASPGCGPENAYCQPVGAGLRQGGLDETVNVNALADVNPAELQAKIDETLVSRAVLRFSRNLPIGTLSEPAELDCGGVEIEPDGWSGGLSWCTRGGTGVTSDGVEFPECCDAGLPGDPDGFGTLDPELESCGCPDFFLAPRAPSSEIGTGNDLALQIPGTETEYDFNLGFVFATTPALVSYSDTVTPTPHSATVSYPVAPDGPGTLNNGFPVGGGPCPLPPNTPPACVDGDVVLTLAFWRPQRRAISDEKCPSPTDPDRSCSPDDWIDIGNLIYTVGGISSPEASSPQPSPGPCPQSAYSPTNPNLTADVHPIQGFGLKDSREPPDQQASTADTVTYTVDVTRCLGDFSWDPGNELQIQFGAGNRTDGVGQSVVFKRE